MFGEKNMPGISSALIQVLPQLRKKTNKNKTTTTTTKPNNPETTNKCRRKYTNKYADK